MSAKSTQTRSAIAFPKSSPRLQEFPSGSFMIDLLVNGEAYVIEYVSGQGYGLSKQKNATFGWEGVDQSFENIDQLEDYVRKLELHNSSNQ